MTNQDNQPTTREIRDRVAVADEGSVILVALWNPAFDHDPRETTRSARALVVPDAGGSGPYWSQFGAVACRDVIGRGGTRSVTIDGETYFEDADSGTVRLEQLRSDVYVEQAHIHRAFYVPRSAELSARLDQFMGPSDEADPR